ncbi:hypothetical protein AAFC00_001069 [Neodothiora populina]|uniref:WD40 repeat-like protein n=1 Tax=Neodothiora populina TaxID=2781224 RepID=A0ABR3PMQ7_9PEZI
MARTKKSKPGAARRQAEKSKVDSMAKPIAVQTKDDSASEASDIEAATDYALQNDDDMSVDEKSEGEEELEKAVFGDSVGFRDGLRAFANADQEADSDVAEEDQEAGAGLEGIADSDLFFTDVGPGADSQALVPVAAGDEESDVEAAAEGHAAAWQDSDDERMVVSLASVPRLRKLRRTEAEDVISGKDYVRRLRKHFEMLNPTPDWARHATQKPARKKRRMTQDGEASEGHVSSDDDDMDVDEDGELSVDPLSRLLQDTSSLVRQGDTSTNGRKRKLRPEVLDVQRTKDIPGVQPSAITSLSFHSSLPLLLSSGPSSTLYLHHIVNSPPAPSPNPLLTSLHIRRTPLTTTAFHPSDSRIFLGARRRYFHVWNLDTGKIEKIARIYGQQHEQRSMEHFKLSPDGRYMALQGSARKGGGVINILDAYTLQWNSQVRIESRGGVADFAWWRDSRGMSVAGKNGEVTEWSIGEQRAVARWQDEGAVGTTTIALGGDNGQTGSAIGKDRWVAVGSSSGVVNIYDRRAWLVSPKTTSSTDNDPVPPHPKPTRTLDQLTTPTSHLAFAPDGQLLVVASRWKKDALRLVHLPTCTVYKNWPTSNTPLGKITGVAFAPGSDALAVANEAGKIRLWEIRP